MKGYYFIIYSGFDIFEFSFGFIETTKRALVVLFREHTKYKASCHGPHPGEVVVPGNKKKHKTLELILFIIEKFY